MDKSVKEGDMDPHTRACTSPWKVLVPLNSVALGSLITTCRVSCWPPWHMLTEPGSRLRMGRGPWERQQSRLQALASVKAAANSLGSRGGSS